MKITIIILLCVAACMTVAQSIAQGSTDKPNPAGSYLDCLTNYGVNTIIFTNMTEQQQYCAVACMNKLPGNIFINGTVNKENLLARRRKTEPDQRDIDVTECNSKSNNIPDEDPEKIYCVITKCLVEKGYFGSLFGEIRKKANASG